jgi:hypothetical protein
MSRRTFEEAVDALVKLSKSEDPIRVAYVDNIVDEYLVGFGDQTANERNALAMAFREKAQPSRRSDTICGRILRDGTV